MYTGNVWGIALLISGFLATLIGFQLLVAALAPRRSERAIRALRERAVASGVLGFVAVGALVVGAAVLGQFGGPGKFLSALLVAAGSVFVVGGLGVVSRFVGERMPSPADLGRPWRATLRGGVTCSLAFVAPFVGWFFVLPAAVVMGTGAVVLSALSASRAPAGTPPLPSESGAAA